ncbi:choice-of-anchor A family protein [Hyalangium rubrum]|uniref:Choice-of-anchor A family protein n=1 Tax=Hyalangium rubrum TaxID=3103134 RepID=A0ABU5H7W2_9BACT|nr:choice-of-anchor A family protein [Hyalangium sp. s54d21]MDY7229533.1 choice-of-anchor A family protein [Hyalangium sp. s54d21]
MKGSSSSAQSTGGFGQAMQACIEVQLGDYNLFLLEDYNQGTSVQGKVAAGGAITLNGFAIGAGLPDGTTAQTLVAGGDLSLSNGGVHGDAWYGGTYSADSSVTFSRGLPSMGTPIDFAARGAELHGLSSALAGLGFNGTTTREPWGGLMMRGTDPELNVFQVNASAFNGAVLWSIDAPAGSFVVVNILGATASFRGFDIQFGGGIAAQAVLYNFVEATAIQAQGFGFRGTVLAPGAELHFSTGSFEGGIYARALTGNAAGYLHPLAEREICTTTGPSNSPPSVSITSPSSSASFTAPATIHVVAEASDSDGTLSNVEFFHNDVLVGTSLSAPYAITLTEVPAGTHRLAAKATDDQGASVTSAVVVVTVQGPVLVITHPFNGSSIQGDRVLVTGHITNRPPHSGVTVNGVLAAVDANANFHASVPLAAGGNTLSATLTTVEGTTLTESVTVVATGQALPFTVTAEPAVGLAPLLVTFTITNLTAQPASFTLEGAGPFSLPANGSSVLSATYPVGVFTPIVVVTDHTGATFSQALVIEAREANQMDQLFGAIWNGMNEALAAGDKARAMKYLNPRAREKYGPVFDALLPFMPEIVASYSPLARASLSPSIGEYAVRRSDNGLQRIHLIYFLQCPDGIWRVDEM